MRSDALYLADILDAIERFVTGFDEARFMADDLPSLKQFVAA